MTDAPPLAQPLAATMAAGLGPVDWVPLARALAKRGERAVLALIVEASGSAPRGEGTWLLITATSEHGTLGGGELERIATLEARALVAGDEPWQRRMTRRGLGPDLGQCCGGRVAYLLQPIDAAAAGWLADVANGLEETGAGALALSIDDPDAVPVFCASGSGSRKAPSTLQGSQARTGADRSGRPRGGDERSEYAVSEKIAELPLRDPRPHLLIFGAGHVGRTFAAFAAALPLRVHVVDDRPDALATVTRTANVIPVLETDPVDYVAKAGKVDAAFVMTYSHDLDFALSRALLARGDIGYVGMIGSKSKAARARKLIAEAGLSDVADRFVSPIGADGPPGKEPGVIALGALSEVLRVLRAVEGS